MNTDVERIANEIISDRVLFLLRLPEKPGAFLITKSRATPVFTPDFQIPHGLRPATLLQVRTNGPVILYNLYSGRG